MVISVDDSDISVIKNGHLFFLKTEIRKNNKGMCPYCKTTRTIKVEVTDFYTVYKCWNKECDRKDSSFAIIENYLHNEYKFNIMSWRY